MYYKHIPVLLKEVIEFLAPKTGGVYFDGTIGGGGYAEAILEASSPDGTLLGFDVDADAINASRTRLAEFGKRAVIEKASYTEIAGIADGRLPRPPALALWRARNDTLIFDGMVLDLGVSSYQLDEAMRGFSFSKEGPLDMRMDREQDISALEIIRRSSAERLEKIFKEFGEEKFGRRIAKKIFENKNGISSTRDLEEVCWYSYPAKMRKGRIHPATRVFQALRIAVNMELQNLERFLQDAPSVLKKDGRIVIVSYHSLEDRIVKTGFKRLAHSGGFELLTKKPLCPPDEETKINPRARSARLRAIRQCM